MSIVGDVPYAETSSPPPPQKLRRPPRKVQTKVCHDPSVSMPIFEGFLDRPELYLDWELEIDDIFSRHVREHKQVRAATSTFYDYASTWWDEYCDLYPEYIPTTWKDLKLAIRYKFVPSYYTRNMIRKLKHL